MLDCGAEHFKLRQLDMPKNFFSGNDCVAEHGNFPDNFLLGVSTPGSDIQFRRQMRSRLSEPLTVAGNPPLKFASASFESENNAHTSPGFPIFLARVLLNDLVSIGVRQVPGLVIFAILYIYLLQLAWHPIAFAAISLVLTEVTMVLLSMAAQESARRQPLGRG